MNDLWEQREGERVEKLEREDTKRMERKGSRNERDGRRSEVKRIHRNEGLERTRSNDGRGSGRRVKRSRTMV